MLKVYHAPRTRSIRILWLLEELGLPYVIEKVAFTPKPMPFGQSAPFGKVPALSERKEDILPLFRHFLPTGAQLTVAAEDALLRHEWPGNVRELQNLAQRTAILSPDRKITPDILGLGQASPEKQLFYQVGVSAAALPLLSLALGEAWVWTFSTFAISSLVIQTVVGAFVSYLTWMWMLGHYPTTRMSAFVFLTPVFALVFGAMWLHEPITINLIAALALVTWGIVLVGRKARLEQANPDTST